MQIQERITSMKAFQKKKEVSEPKSYMDLKMETQVSLSKCLVGILQVPYTLAQNFCPLMYFKCNSPVTTSFALGCAGVEVALAEG